LPEPENRAYTAYPRQLGRISRQIAAGIASSSAMLDRVSMLAPAVAVLGYVLWMPHAAPASRPLRSLLVLVALWTLLLIALLIGRRRLPRSSGPGLDGTYLSYQAAACLALISADVWYVSAPYSHPVSWQLLAASALIPPALSVTRTFIDARLTQGHARRKLLLPLVSSLATLCIFESVYERLVPHDSMFEGRIAQSSPDRSYWYIVSSPGPDGSNRANSLGFLGPEPPRSPHALQVLLLGDSIPAAGREVNFPGVAEAQLRQEVRRPIEITNASIDGFGTEQILRFYRERLGRLRPRIVVLSFYMDDVNRELRYRKGNWLYTPGWPEWMQDVYHGCATCRLLLNVRGFDESTFLLYRRRSVEEALPDALAVVEALSREVRARGAIFALFNIPVFRWSGVLRDTGSYEFAHLNDQLARWCQERSIPYYDAAPDLVGKDISSMRIGDSNIHFNDHGHREIGAILASFILGLSQGVESP
jgi:hypothetical protein